MQSLSPLTASQKSSSGGNEGAASVPTNIVRVIVDVANMSDSTALDLMLKVKPLWGYGRMEWAFVLRQSGKFAVSASLEVVDTVRTWIALCAFA